MFKSKYKTFLSDPSINLLDKNFVDSFDSKINSEIKDEKIIFSVEKNLDEIQGESIFEKKITNINFDINSLSSLRDNKLKTIDININPTSITDFFNKMSKLFSEIIINGTSTFNLERLCIDLNEASEELRSILGNFQKINIPKTPKNFFNKNQKKIKFKKYKI